MYTDKDDVFYGVDLEDVNKGRFEDVRCNGGCPFCQCDDEGITVKIESNNYGEIARRCRCSFCKGKWYEVYELERICFPESQMPHILE